MGYRQLLVGTGWVNWSTGNRPFLISKSGYTGTAWINLDNDDNQGFYDIVRGSISESSRFELSVHTNGNIYVAGRGPDFQNLVTWFTDIPAGTGMAHWASVFDLAGNTITIYKNGVQVGHNSFAGLFSPSSNTIPYFAITGCHDSGGGGSRFTKGAIHDMRIYGRALSAAEIQTIYASRGNDNILTGLELMVRAQGVHGAVVTTANMVELGPEKYSPNAIYGSSQFEADNLSFRRR